MNYESNSKASHYKTIQTEVSNLEIKSFELSEIDYDMIKFVVLLAEYEGQLIIIRNKTRTLWELPGGKREPGEHLLKAASRELFEETGAISFELTPYGIYQMDGSYGMNFYARITELGELPEYEIAEIKLSENLPKNLNYGQIYYKMYDQWNEVKNKREFKKYFINYKDIRTKYEF